MSTPGSTSQPSVRPSMRVRFTSWCSRRRWWIEVVVVILLGAWFSRYLEHSGFWIEKRFAIYNQIQSVLPSRSVSTTVLLIGDEAYWKGEPAGRVPISRSYLAHVIKALAEVKPPLQVIALDFDFRAHISEGSERFQPPAYLPETQGLVQAIRYAASKNIKVVLPKSVWREGGRFVEERDVYEDPELFKSTQGCDPLIPAGCGPLQIPDLRETTNRKQGESPVFAATDRERGLYFGYIALPHKTWRLPLPLHVDDKLDENYQLDPFSLAVARARNDHIGGPALDNFAMHSTAPFARYLNAEQWGDYKIVAAAKIPDLVRQIESDHTKVLLIGGDWHTRAYQQGDFADRYATPAGEIPGALIHANYAEDFWSEKPRAVNEWLLLTLDCLFAFALAWLLKRADESPQDNMAQRFKITGAKILIVTAAVFVTVIAGYLAMLGRYFFDLTVVVLGVLGHYAFDSVDWPWRERHTEAQAANAPAGVTEMPRPAIPNTTPGKEHAPRKKKRSASARVIVGGLLLGLSLGSGRLHAASQQTNSGAKSDQQQPYKDNDIDVNKPGGARGPKIPWVIVQMVDAKGANLGRATITSLKSGGVEVKLDLSDLPPGEHALHFHQVPKCDPPDFKSAGPHFNPEKKEHGLKNPKGPHAGDVENFSVGPDGITTATVKDLNVSLGGKNSLLANGGTALVIHAKPDDMKTDPAGNAGDRIACGVVSH